MERKYALSYAPPRFRAKVQEENDCWIWTGSLHVKGYGHFSAKGRPIMAHRFAYEYFVGPIPEGMTIDHLCKRNPCVNPAHLEPTTCAENIRRGGNAAKTHCKHGHPFDEANTLHRAGGGRGCRTCARESARRRRA